MRKCALLNSDLARVIGLSAHTDEITIADAGLPVPESCERIDLALTHGVPAFIDTLKIVATELQIESVVIAEELLIYNSVVHTQLLQLLDEIGEAQSHPIRVNTISHQAFKIQTANSRAVVRTGECTPYANIILQAGVVFK
ncbi:ribose transport protein RbsD [Shewanella psychrophila]|uniref:D-ribose pyranase n=1 Tax=Shewanella psychrophila TaxID=225848 RepID=A0A1S6HQV6_9GAMM|nr:D-ribose pyranase [Shewanella psychrophila]AQS37903.1 ribose transport protein RbsD [Shewanella psychrophila]